MKLMIYFSNEQNKVKVTHSLEMLLRRAIVNTLVYEKVGGECEVSLTFTDNENIHELNRRYRNIDRPTDVLSFPQEDFSSDGADKYSDDYKVLGDIVISLEKAEEQGREFGHSTEHEAAFLAIHSTLHLLGYDHETSVEDEHDMFARQKKIVSLMTGDFAKFD